MRVVRSGAGLVRVGILLTLSFFVAVAAGCGGPQGDGGSGGVGGESGGGNNRTLTVFAAASLTDAFGELAATFEEENPGVEVRTSFAGSSTLAAQIIQGAPADVYASADGEQMDRVREEGALAGEPETFAENAVVITVPEDNPAGIQSLGDLANPDVELVLAQEEVPVAKYAGEVLENANAEYGDGFSQRTLDNLVSREADTRAAINRVALGEADATLSYSSDVTPDIRGEVQNITIPEEFNVTPTYPIAVLEGAESPELARQWVEFVLGDEGQRVLREWGFQPVSPGGDQTGGR